MPMATLTKTSKRGKNRDSIQIDRENKGKLDALAKLKGMTLREFLNRTIEWMHDLDDVERLIVLRQLTEDGERTIREVILRQTAIGDVGDAEAASEAPEETARRRRGPKPA